MNIEEIKKDIGRNLKTATMNTYRDGINIIEESFDVFYSQGDPKRKRTGTLKGAAHNPPPTISNTSAYLKVGYEGNNISYSDGTFSGGEVLGATMTGTYGVVGNPSYDEEAFDKVIQSAEKNFSSAF